MKTTTVELRAIAIFEAAKGVVVLVAGSGLLLLVHRDVQAFADRIILHLHLNPASRYPRIFHHLATQSSPARLKLLALGALLYAIIRIVEAVGLWRARHWAEWLGIATGAMYMPFELMALVRKPGLEPVVAIAVNLAIVAFLGLRVRRDRRARRRVEELLALRTGTTDGGRNQRDAAPIAAHVLGSSEPSTHTE